MGNIRLENFNRLEVEIDYKPIVDKFGDDTAKYLQRTSPRGRRRNKTYAQGWVFLVDKKTKGEYGGKVWNETNYQLTHLLENGHLIVNKKGGVGWASGNPHIDKAYQQIKTPFQKAMENVEIKTQFK